VPAPKVHRGSKEMFFSATRPVPAPKVHRESKEKIVLRCARCAGFSKRYVWALLNVEN